MWPISANKTSLSKELNVYLKISTCCLKFSAVPLIHPHLIQSFITNLQILFVRNCDKMLGNENGRDKLLEIQRNNCQVIKKTKVWRNSPQPKTEERNEKY